MKRVIQTLLLVLFSALLLNGFLSQPANQAQASVAPAPTGNPILDGIAATIQALEDLCTEDCGGGLDAGADAGDAGDAGGLDAGADAGLDAGGDAGLDAGADAGDGGCCGGCECTGPLALVIDALTEFYNTLAMLFGMVPAPA